jgi:hypothetical protein
MCSLPVHNNYTRISLYYSHLSSHSNWPISKSTIFLGVIMGTLLAIVFLISLVVIVAVSIYEDFKR